MPAVAIFFNADDRVKRGEKGTDLFIEAALGIATSDGPAW
jgi:hypothetical protein